MYTLIGKSCSGSQTHGCPFGDGKGPKFSDCKLYTLDDVANHHKVKTISPIFMHFFNLLSQEFVEKGGGVKKHAKKYNNFINPTLITGDGNCTVLSKVNVPELHCMIGRIYFRRLRNIIVLLGDCSKLMGEIEKCWPSKPEGRAWMDQYLKRVRLCPILKL